MLKKYFTVEEANQILPVVKIELEHLQRIRSEFAVRMGELRLLKKNAANHQDRIFSLEATVDFLHLEANTHIRNIHDQGVQLKDIEIGLLDFPALLHGEEVLLCWRMGEDQISHYHGLEEGYQGRKPL